MRAALREYGEGLFDVQRDGPVFALSWGVLVVVGRCRQVLVAIDHTALQSVTKVDVEASLDDLRINGGLEPYVVQMLLVLLAVKGSKKAQRSHRKGDDGRDRLGEETVDVQKGAIAPEGDDKVDDLLEHWNGLYHGDSALIHTSSDHVLINWLGESNWCTDGSR